MWREEEGCKWVPGGRDEIVGVIHWLSWVWNHIGTSRVGQGESGNAGEKVSAKMEG